MNANSALVATFLAYAAIHAWINTRRTPKTNDRLATELVALTDRIAVARTELVRLRDDIGRLRGTVAEIRTDTAIAITSDVIVKVERTSDNRIRVAVDATLNPEQAEGLASELYQHAYQILHEQARDTCTLEGHQWGPARNGRQPDGTQTHIRHCTREHCDHDEVLPGWVEAKRENE